MVNIHRPLAIVLLLFFAGVAEGSRVGVYRAWESAQLRRDVSIDITEGLAHFWNPSGADSNNDQVGGLTSTKVGSGTVVRGQDGWDFQSAAVAFELSAPISNSTNAYAISAWIKPDITQMNSHDFGGWILSDRNPSSDGWDFQFLYEKTLGTIRHAKRDKINDVSYQAISEVLTHNTWVHLFVVADRAALEIRMYQDGDLVDTVSVPSAAAASVWSNASTRTRIGHQSWGAMDATYSGQQYRGQLDKLRFYNDIVPSEEFIRAVYQHDGKAKGILP